MVFSVVVLASSSFLRWARNVRFWPTADIAGCAAHVRSWGKADIGCYGSPLSRSLLGVKRTFHSPQRKCLLAIGIAAAVAAGRLTQLCAPAALNFDHFCVVFLRIYDRYDYDRISLLNRRAGGFRCFFAVE